MTYGGSARRPIASEVSEPFRERIPVVSIGAIGGFFRVEGQRVLTRLNLADYHSDDRSNGSSYEVDQGLE